MARKTRGRRRKRNTISQKKTLLIGGVCFAAVLVVALIVCFAMNRTVNRVAKDIIHDKVYIGAVDVSGMNKKEALAALDELQAQYQETTVKLNAKEIELEVTLGELGVHFSNRDQLVKQAISYGKKGNLWSRYQKVKELEETAVVFEIAYGVDPELVKGLIAAKLSNLQGAAVNATLKRENDQFVITDGKAGIKIDEDAAIHILEEYFNERWEIGSAGVVTLVTTVDEPDVTREQLQKVKDVLGTYSTSFKASNNRGKNIKNAASRLNGKLLLPGEEMSASDSMGSRNAANGYLKAGSYLNGETIDTYGGGVCQVSTTLYNAVLLAELEITERACHSMVVDYVPPSMDAAISEGVLDLKIKNNTQSPVYIEAITVGGKLTFTIYGEEVRSSNRTVSYVSETLSVTDPGKKFVATADAVGVYKKAVSAHKGMKAQLWKVVTENGIEVSREVCNKSSYKASQAVYHVGVGTDNAQAAEILKNAVATQNEAAITAAIAQAQAIIAEATSVTPDNSQTAPQTN